MEINLHDICVFDILNKLNIRENGTTTVQVIDIHKRLFRKPLYTVLSLQTGDSYKVSKDYLTPIPQGQIPTLIRYQDNFPPINEEDLKTIEAILNHIDTDNLLYKNLCKLHLKMELYSKVKML